MNLDFSILCCPYVDHGALKIDSETKLICLSCGRTYPIVDGRPVLIDESRSIFTIEEIMLRSDKKQFPNQKGWRYHLRRLFPAGVSRVPNLDKFRQSIASLSEKPKILIVGCGNTQKYYEALILNAQFFFCDVTLQGDAMLVCDGHCMPFSDGVVDGVVIDQILEHVISPADVVEEIYRCLKPGGIIYSGIPFYFPIHNDPFDFQRLTPIGHRILFWKFEQLYLEITQGAFTAFSLACIAWLSSFSTNLWWRRISSFSIRVIFKSLLWLDKAYKAKKNLTIPANTAFLGKKTENTLTIREILKRW